MKSCFGVTFPGLHALGGLALLALSACGSTASNGPPPQTVAPLPHDGSLPPPERSKAKSIIVPSDTGLGTQPSGVGQSTGTEGRMMSPTIGNPGN